MSTRPAETASSSAQLRWTRCAEVKVVLLGDAGVGKSSLARRFVHRHFQPFAESTIGASFMSKTLAVDGREVKAQIWDTAGQEKYHSLAPMYYRGAGAAIVVYDVSSAASLVKLKRCVGRRAEERARATLVDDNSARLVFQ
mmetsp:Transcript_14636/g.58485  ORF Transcript_14636/g.58485 Transcript_14636/m.58485 type:complete len:141 (-) Transcript_14636:695-1117(-)